VSLHNDYISLTQEGEHDLTTMQQVFTITCRLNAKTAEEGRGPTKKYAKRVAADKVLQKLKQAIQDPSQAPNLFPDMEQDALCQKLASLSVSKKPKGGLDLLTLCGPAKPPMTLAEGVQFLKGLTGPKWEKFMVRLRRLSIANIALISRFSFLTEYESD